jgi:hypothetical protein
MKLLRLACGVAAAGALAVCSACLDFDEQKIYAEHDEKADQLIFVIQYEGIYATGEAGEAQNQLGEAVQNKTIALGGNWPFAFPIEKLKKELAGVPDVNDKRPPDLRRRMLDLLNRITVLNGGFYHDAAGRLCGMQVVVIDRANDTVALANRLINEHIILQAVQEGAVPEGGFKLAALEAARKGHTWLTLKGNSLIVRAPMPEAEAAEGRAEFFANIKPDGDATPGEQLQWLKTMLSNPVYVWHEDNTLSVKLGHEGRPGRYTGKAPRGKYNHNMDEHVLYKYGFKLDELLARYLADPNAAANTEAEKAARIMAPRLAKAELVRVLVERIRVAPNDALRKLLRDVPLEPEIGQQELTDEQRLEAWANWLKEQAQPQQKAGE